MCSRNGWTVVAVIAAGIGLLCMTAGYVVNKQYNDSYWATKCTFTAYNFQPFTWNNWDCKSCTAWHASITTVTADGRTWWTHNVNVYPKGNSVERQTRWYQMHWPIGQTVPCWQTGCCSSQPIFELADVDGTFWSGIVFLSIFGIVITGIIISVIIEKIRHRGYVQQIDIPV